MKKETLLVKFRLKQVTRTLQDVGYGYLLVLVPLGFLFSLFLLERLQNFQNKDFTLIFYPLVVLSIHGKRKDGFFLAKLEVKKWLLFVMEYSLAAIPLSLLLLFLQLFQQIAIGQLCVIGLAVILSRVPVNFSWPKTNWTLGRIPDYLFEWRGTFRQYNYGLVAFWWLGLLMAANVFAYCMFALIFFSFVPATFKPTEGKELIPKDKRHFHRKIMGNNGFLLLLLLPHALVFLVFNSAYWFLILGYFFFLLLLQTYCICYKYANYAQGRDTANDVPVLVFILLFLFLPFSLFLLAKAYGKVQVQISTYVKDRQP